MSKNTKISHPPTVYVVQRPRAKGDGWVPNLEPATKYGQLRFLFDADERIFDRIESARSSLIRLFEERPFDSDRDFLLWPNFCDPCAMWLAISVLAPRTSKIQFLYWSRTPDGGGFYFPVVIPTTK